MNNGVPDFYELQRRILLSIAENQKLEGIVAKGVRIQYMSLTQSLNSHLKYM